MTADAELVKRLLERYGARQNLRNPDGAEAAAAIERLTRERDEAISSRALAVAAKEHAYRERQHLRARAEAAEAEVEVLKEALRPFARLADEAEGTELARNRTDDATCHFAMALGHFRRARAALKGE